jgi:hypothetical protein
MTFPKPRRTYQLWIKQQGEWRFIASSDNPNDDTLSISRVSMTGNGSIERVELRDHHGASALRTLYDKTWGGA